MAPFKPRLLRETAEIAFSQIKRFIEPRLAEEFSLRRVTPPLYVPVGSGLNDPGEAIRFRLPGTGQEVELVNGLNRWLRTQLVRYDIAPGFGVFAVMNAVRPMEIENSTRSPHYTAWAWQQVISDEDATAEHLTGICKKLYTIMCETEAHIIKTLPHLDVTLPPRIAVLQLSDLSESGDEKSEQRMIYEYLHSHTSRSLILYDAKALTSKIYVWNKIVGCPLPIAEIAIDTARPVTSVGGSVLRDQFAMQILHQPHLLT